MNQASVPQVALAAGDGVLGQPVGVVVIGRNEGDRLRRCLESLIAQGAGPMVYVDSGSTDGSVDMARGLGVWVEPLDTSVPFTMARGRNAGFGRLRELYPELDFVQFVDGDCEVERGWMQAGLSLLLERPDVVAVCGFRRERFPESTVYNQLINLEWQGVSGEVSACGGDAIYRTRALVAVGAFNEGMIAGEEPELCVRLRRGGGKIWRLNVPMTIHDAAMTRFSQWWKRARRTGHAYAEGWALHGSAPFFHNRRSLRSCLFLGGAVPLLAVAALALLPLVPWLFPLVLALGALAYARAARGAYLARRAIGNSPEQARFHACFCMMAKFPELQGALEYFFNRARGKRTGLIEYRKEPTGRDSTSSG